MGFAELRLGVNLVSYKSPVDFTPKFGSSFGEGIDSYSDLALISYQTASSIAPSQTVRLQAQLNQLKLLIEQEKWQEANSLSDAHK